MSGKYYIEANQFEGRFAEEEEIKKEFKSNCYSREVVNGAGLHVISDGDEAIVDDGENSTGVVASTGSGKTRRILMQYIYSCILKGEAIICNDPKGEVLRQMRKTLEKMKYRIIVMDYREPMKGDRYNHLEYPAKLYKSGEKSKALEMFSSFNTTIFSRYKSEKDPYWTQTASSLSLGYMAMMAEQFDIADITIKNVYDVHIQGNERYGASTYMKEFFCGKEDSVAYELVNPAINAPNETRSSVYSVFTSCMSSFVQNEDIIDMTSNSTFDVEDLLKKTAIFFITRDETDVYDSLISATIDQLYTSLIDIAEKRYNGRLKRRVNFIIDEFGSLSEIPYINNKITACRSRNIRWLLVYQSLEQLSLTYGNKIAPIIIGNCVNLVYMHSSDMGLLKMISERSGMTIDEYTNERRALISVERLQHFNKESGECLMFLNRLSPFVAHLPDISEYPAEYSENLGVVQRERQNWKRLDFKKLVKDMKQEQLRESTEEKQKIQKEQWLEEERKKREMRYVPKTLKRTMDKIIQAC